jgi:hypothetical protein
MPRACGQVSAQIAKLAYKDVPMKRFAWSFSMIVVLSCTALSAQEINFRTDNVEPPSAPAAAKEHTLTPEMYRYLADLQRYGGPQDLTRQRAQREADLRKERLNAMRWYGYSNSRPFAEATPFTNTYGPRWTGNVRNQPGQWRDAGHHQTYITSQGGVPALR